MTKVETIWRFVLVAATAMLIAPAAANEFSVHRAELMLPVELRATVIEYYSAENKKDWVKTYALRRRGFRELVRFDDYVTTMNEGMTGWFLHGVEIERVYSGKYAFRDPIDVIYIDILFQEQVVGNFYLFGGYQHATTPEGDRQWSRGVTAWVFEDDAWRCLDCGFRGHLVLNMPMFLQKGSSGDSNCLAGQADSGIPRHSVPSLIMALSMTSIFRMHATMATFGFLPAPLGRL